MKSTPAICFLVLFASLFLCMGVRSQDPFLIAAGERIQVCTDRTLYISGEKVFFSAVIFNVRDPQAAQVSRAFYGELITPDGKKIAGGKYLLQNSSGQGCLTIPEETISGFYFLRFYTRFMRNISTDEYKYILLKIINPFKTEVLPGKDKPDTTQAEANNRIVVTGDGILEILTEKKSFSPGEEIRLSINGNKGKGMHPGLCLSVIPESTDLIQTPTIRKGQNSTDNRVYFPETRGISLSGKVNGKESGKPVPGVQVNLSIIGDKDILVVCTDSSGRFFFALPDDHGNKDIFLCAANLPDIVPEILIDNDFCSRPVNLPSLPFILNEDEMKAAFNLAVNARISSRFREEVNPHDSLKQETDPPFYGVPSEVVVMDKYIDLPTLGEYFTELSMMVSLRKVHGKKQFRFFTTQPEMSIYDPLVLVDWVAVENIDKVLAMAPRDIERIELVNSPYVKGNITYGGIISFVSRKHDFAGIDLPASGTFVNYSFLEECTGNLPQDLPRGNIPDSRNTVYWNPDVQTNDQGSALLSFTAPRIPGRYIILLRKMSSTGEILISKEIIDVVKD